MAFKSIFVTALAASSLVAAAPQPEDVSVLPSAHIIGGVQAKEGEFPYMVSLSTGGSHFCGGVLLDADTVLTAAHCSVGWSPTEVMVRAGSLTWASNGTQVGVGNIVVHPNYNAARINHDVAIWTLSERLEESEMIGFATLPKGAYDPADGDIAITAGWGYTSTSAFNLPNRLWRVRVPIVGRDECRESYGVSEVTDKMICAGLEEGGKDSCQGDSGGPIIDAKTGVLLGLVSWGYGCAEPDYPGVYARVSSFIPFIRKNMST